MITERESKEKKKIRRLRAITFHGTVKKMLLLQYILEKLTINSHFGAQIIFIPSVNKVDLGLFSEKSLSQVFGHLYCIKQNTGVFY